MSIEHAQKRLKSPENIRAWGSLYARLVERQNALGTIPESERNAERALSMHTQAMGRILTTLPMMASLPEGGDRVADAMKTIHEHYLEAEDALRRLVDARFVTPDLPKIERLREKVASDAGNIDRAHEQAVRDLLDVTDAVLRGVQGAGESGQRYKLFDMVNGVAHPRYGTIRQAQEVIEGCLALCRSTGFRDAGLSSIPDLAEELRQKLALYASMDPTKGQARRAMDSFRQAIERGKGEFDSKPLRLGGILLAGSVLLVNLGTGIAKPLFKKEPFQGISLVDVGWGAALLSMLYPKALSGTSLRAREKISEAAKDIAPEISATRRMTGSNEDRVAAFEQAQALRTTDAALALRKKSSLSEEELCGVAGKNTALTRTLHPLTESDRAKAFALLSSEMTPSIRRSLRTLLDDPTSLVRSFEEQCAEESEENMTSAVV